MSSVLVLNTGSSSIKAAVFDAALTCVLTGAVSGVGGRGAVRIGDDRRQAEIPDHETGLSLLLAGFEAQGVSLDQLGAAGHRVVHGGDLFTAPVRVTAEVEAGVEACCALAPLHNPHALAAIRALRRLAPTLPQCASFDTAFHASNPEVARRYAISTTLSEQGVKRYGFHGLSYASLVDALGEETPPRLLACHLGNGASLCAIRDGRSVATTMGYSPLDGLTMGTRSGAIDAMAALRIARSVGVDEAETELNRRSGLLGLAGDNDMAALMARNDREAEFAIEHFCYWAARHAGSMIVAMGGLDAIAFTGGIGENASGIRDRIVDQLAFLPSFDVIVVQANEERRIAQDVLSLIAA